MSVDAKKVAIGEFLEGIRERLDQAASIARAAEACAEAGNPGKGVEVALDVEQLLYEASTLLNGASLINRADF
jgi:hypothetical protein